MLNNLFSSHLCFQGNTGAGTNCFGFRDVTPQNENQMERNVENQDADWVYEGLVELTGASTTTAIMLRLFEIPYTILAPRTQNPKS